MKITAKQLNLHANGIPPASVKQFSKVARAAINSGCSLVQARCLASLAYHAASGFHWNILPSASGLEIHTKLKN